MSRVSRFLIGVMVTGLAFLAGLRAWQAYERRAQEEAAARPPAMTFHNVPVSHKPQPPDAPVYKRLPPPGAAPQEIYLQDGPLDAAQEKEQARQTIASILNDYRADPQIQAFYADLRRATGRADIDLASLSGDGLSALMKDYPQVQQVMAEHAKDPEFVKTLQEIFNNPQFVRSVAVLQGPARARNAE